MSEYVKEIIEAYKNKQIILDDIFLLYNEGYLSTKECQQVLNEGGKYGIRKL